MSEKRIYEVKYVEGLEQGSCRFNCRTKKQAFIDGFKAGASSGWIGGEPERAYKEWCEQED